MSENKSARLLLTVDCHRKCAGCCNTYKSVMKGASTISSLKCLDKYDSVMLTGGEPLMYPRLVETVSRYLKDQGKKVYLYTTVWDAQFRVLFKYLDGIHYTLHAPFSKKDLEMFNQFQRSIALHGRGQYRPSFRCYIDPKVDWSMSIRPNLFSRLEVKPWVEDGNCPVPEDDLLYLNDLVRKASERLATR